METVRRKCLKCGTEYEVQGNNLEDYPDGWCADCTFTHCFGMTFNEFYPSGGPVPIEYEELLEALEDENGYRN